MPHFDFCVREEDPSTPLGERKGVVDNSRDHILATVDGSLKRLGIEHLDILLLHWPDSLVEAEGVAEAFDKLKRSGKVRYFGVSNHSRDQIEILQKYVRHPANIVPIIGATKSEHVVENCQADGVELTHDEWYRLLHAASGIYAQRPAAA